MALFHLESKFHSKKTKGGKAKSISSIVAYRHCFAMGEYNYTNKPGLITSFMLMPEDILNNTINSPYLNKFFEPEIAQEIKQNIQNGDCVSLWQAIEAKEKRKDAQLCEELIISLQHELTLEENIKNLKKLINENYIKVGKVADICIHDSGNNLHAHVLITQRPLTAINIDMTGKPTYEFGNKIRDQLFSAHGKMDQITPIREMWANLCNLSFKNAGLDVSISDKTLAKQHEIALEQGNEILAAELNREPVKHIYVEPAKLEVEARKAELHNENELKLQKLSMELADAGEISHKDIYSPDLVPVARTFKEKLEQRKINRLEIIKNNVTRYIQNRANKYSPIIRKARERATNTIHSVANLIRNQQKGIFNSVPTVNFQRARSTVETITKTGELKHRELENTRRNQQKMESKNTKQLLLEEIEKEIKNTIYKIPKWEYGKYTPNKI